MKYDIKHYEDEIQKYHIELQDYPDSTTLQNKLNYRLSKWVSKLDIIVMAANNEQKPYSSEELGMKVKPMYTKAISGFDQVADYQFFIGGTVNKWGGLLIERKELSDLYGSLMNRDSRERFYREILRYECDNRFTQMIIMVEGTMQDFLKYAPKFNGKIYNKNHVGANVESRRATIAGLYARGIPILWCGSRDQAVKIYPQLVKQWVVKHYDELIGI